MRRALSSSQVARMAGVSDQTIRRWVDAGLIRCWRLPSGHLRFDEYEVRSFLVRRGIPC